jgi:hypothetical protein
MAVNGIWETFGTLARSRCPTSSHKNGLGVSSDVECPDEAYVHGHDEDTSLDYMDTEQGHFMCCSCPARTYPSITAKSLML